MIEQHIFPDYENYDTFSGIELPALDSDEIYNSLIQSKLTLMIHAKQMQSLTHLL